MKRFALLLIFACGPVTEREDVARSTHAIVGGVPSPASDDAVVMIARFSETGTYYQCSAAVIAPRLVLTALHCVTGRPPGALRVFTGSDAWSKIQSGKPEARGERVFVSSHFDAAVVLLDRDLATPIAPVRLDEGVRRGERVDAVGFGVDAGGKSPSLRHRRSDLPVLDVGPSTTRIGEMVLTGEFVIGEAVCSGDSGGPALAESGAVVGIASRVGNGAAGADGAAFCLGNDAHDVYVGTAILAPLLREAFDAAGASPALETKSATLEVEEQPEEHGGCR
jgi:trypsin